MRQPSNMLGGFGSPKGEGILPLHPIEQTKEILLFDLHPVGFLNLKNAIKMAAIATSLKRLLPLPLRSLVAPSSVVAQTQY